MIWELLNSKKDACEGKKNGVSQLNLPQIMVFLKGGANITENKYRFVFLIFVRDTDICNQTMFSLIYSKKTTKGPR